MQTQRKPRTPVPSLVHGDETCRLRFPSTPIVVLSMWEMELNARNVMSVGANGFISETTGKVDTIAGIQHVPDGEFIDVLEGNDQPATTLGPRKLETLTLVPRGFINNEIGQQMAISSDTVRNCLREVMSDLNVDT